MTNSKNSSSNSSKSKDLYAIAETSGQQFWFEVNRYYDIDRLNAKEKDKITLDKVLLLKDKDFDWEKLRNWEQLEPVSSS